MWSESTPDLIVVLCVVVGVLVMLARTRIPADAIMVAALAVLVAIPMPSADGWTLGVVSVAAALAGFSNPGMLTVGILFAVVAGMRATGAIDVMANALLGRPSGERAALLRVTAPALGMSVFLNNTAVVAMMIPAVQSFARRVRVSPSVLLIPLSYAAILGGTCTLIGTSTNLVVAGLVLTETDLPPLRMFDITWVGVPCAIVGGLFLLLVAPPLLRRRQAAAQSLSDVREYALELVVPEGSPIDGLTVEVAGLRHLPGCFLVEIERRGEILPAVGPTQVLRANDRLLFAGVVDSIRDLARTRGLVPATDQVLKLDAPRFHRRLYEVVVSTTSPLVGKTIREGRFRNRYEGAVIAVSRNGERIRGRIGDVRIRAGDLLLVEAGPDFSERVGQSRDFLLASALSDSAPRRHGRAWIAIAILIAMVTVAALEIYPMLVAALLAAIAMVLCRCCSIAESRRSVDWSVLIVIGAALGLGKALDESGAASLIAGGLVRIAGEHPWMALIAVYVATSLLTEVVTNNAAVALVFPIAYTVSLALGVDFMPFAIAIMVAGSASFATPLGYQTNLMVYGPGGYAISDFLRVGVPMNVIVGVTAIASTLLLFRF